jgi:hypothetical protein
LFVYFSKGASGASSTSFSSSFLFNFVLSSRSADIQVFSHVSQKISPTPKTATEFLVRE